MTPPTATVPGGAPAPTATGTCYTTMSSPVGELLLVSRGHGLAGLFMETDATGTDGPSRRAVEPSWVRRDDLFDDARDQLCSYFAGELEDFSVELDLQGTPFQLEVWAALRLIPYGTTLTYRELAARIGRPQASRAVGAANGRNPVSIIVPCHRVIGASGRLTGYAYGLDRKRLLLELEGRLLKAGHPG